MNYDIEKLINSVKEVGSITARQREIIIDKARQLGEDISEVEFYLENIPILDATRPMSPNGEKRKKCPNCGAVIYDTFFQCPDCGYTFQKENIASEDSRKCIEALQEKLRAASIPLSKIEKTFRIDLPVQRQITIINSFSLPFTKEGLIQLLEFSYSNYISIGNSQDEMHLRPLKNAWYGKTIQVLNALSRIGENDPQIISIVSSYNSLIKIEKKKISPRAKALLCAFLLLIISFGGCVIGTKCNNLALDKVSTCIENHDYSGAKAAAQKCGGDINKLIDDILVQEVNYLISTGKIQQAQIVAASINDSNKKESMIDAINNVK